MEINFSSKPESTPRIEVRHEGLVLEIDPTYLRPDGVGGLRRVVHEEITEGLLTTARELYAYQGVSDIDFVMMVANAFLSDWEIDEFIKKAMELSNGRKQEALNEQIHGR